MNEIIKAAKAHFKLCEQNDYSLTDAEIILKELIDDYEKTGGWLDQAAKQIHYPEHWDTSAYPTVESAIHEIIFTYECNSVINGNRCRR